VTRAATFDPTPDGAYTMTETQFLEAVLDVALRFGWRRAHFRPARTRRGWRTAMSGDVGFPDVVLVHVETGTLLVRELKTAVGKVTDEQRAWLDGFAACEVDTGVWRPRDWPMIVTQLSGGRARVAR